MPIQQFSKSEAIKFGWEKMKSNFWSLVGILLVAWVIQGVLSGASERTKETAGINFLIGIVILVVSVIINTGLIKIALKLRNNEKVGIADLFSMLNKFIDYIAAAFLYGLIVLGGLILLIVPGIIWGIKYQFYGYLIIDKNLGPIEAIKKSGQMTQGHKWNLLGFGLLLALINLAGVIALGIGLFATVPTALVATAYVYKKLLGEGEGGVLAAEAESVAPTPVIPPSDVISEAPRA